MLSRHGEGFAKSLFLNLRFHLSGVILVRLQSVDSPASFLRFQSHVRKLSNCSFIKYLLNSTITKLSLINRPIHDLDGC